MGTGWGVSCGVGDAHLLVNWGGIELDGKIDGVARLTGDGEEELGAAIQELIVSSELR